MSVNSLKRNKSKKKKTLSNRKCKKIKVALKIKEEMKRIARKIQSDPDNPKHCCILCENRAEMVNLFIPNEAQEKAKIYTICSGCATKTEEIEKIIGN